MIPVSGQTGMTNLLRPVWTGLEDEFDTKEDEIRALDEKSEQFWQPLLKSAEEEKPVGHEALYKDVEAVLADLPVDDSYVREALQEAVTELQNADGILAEQASQTSQLAAVRLTDTAADLEEDSSVTDPQGWLCWAMSAVGHFTGLSYKQRLHQQVEQRQSDILPSLRGAERATGNVLNEVRKASTRGYDVLKYDLYHKVAHKTPEAAKNVAQRIIDAANEDRHKFLRPVMTSVEGLTRDAREEDETPSATVSHSIEV